ncbi:ISAs1 family transposase [Cereibacter johrii]|uniref:ISAs1 family transposase n=1 Tax=Cereibacter johrii TaxID=445629 RepID=UPI002B206BCC|nr:ISAs1 family transposase [Cereibacter johrii]MEA5163509.1 ISAs1 family transposase [Cereibacter johrii]
MMVSAYASRLRLTLATVPADRGAELEAAIEALGLIALKAKVVTGDALHCNRRTVAAINAQGGDWCLALKGNQESLLSDARGCFSKRPEGHPEAVMDEMNHDRRDVRKTVVVSAKPLAEHHEFPGLKGFGRIEAAREVDGKVTSERRFFALSWLPTPEVFLAAVRAYWAIGNALHGQHRRAPSPRPRCGPPRHIQNVAVPQTQTSRLGRSLPAQTSHKYLNSFVQKRLPCEAGEGLAGSSPHAV